MGINLNDRELDTTDLGILQEKFGEAESYLDDIFLSNEEVGLKELKKIENLIDQWKDLDEKLYEREGEYSGLTKSEMLLRKSLNE